ncbi:MAG: endonuclease domain-containing protein [Chloroflexi bacterium]|nr:endonuclease domain-containing protein [Chloroflexota bacterium]
MDSLPVRARRLRRNPTDAEVRLWQALRHRRFSGHKFRRQQPLGGFIVDFVSVDRRLIIEVDGAQYADQAKYDAVRDAWLTAQGFRVMRFSDFEVMTELESVEEAIWEAIERPPPNPPPRGGRA